MHDATISLSRSGYLCNRICTPCTTCTTRPPSSCLSLSSSRAVAAEQRSLRHPPSRPFVLASTVVLCLCVCVGGVGHRARSLA